MILKEVRTTIRDRIIGLGFVEWDKSFDDQDIPETLLENSFHVAVTGGSGNGINQAVLDIENDVVLTLWKKGFRNPVEAMDAGLETLQGVLCDLLGPVIRTLPAFRKINMSSYQLEPISSDNESVCKIIINLSVVVAVEVTQAID